MFGKVLNNKALLLPFEFLLKNVFDLKTNAFNKLLGEENVLRLHARPALATVSASPFLLGDNLQYQILKRGDQKKNECLGGS